MVDGLELRPWDRQTVRWPGFESLCSQAQQLSPPMSAIPVGWNLRSVMIVGYVLGIAIERLFGQ